MQNTILAMKHLLLPISIILVLLDGCSKPDYDSWQKNSEYEPVFMSREDLNKYVRLKYTTKELINTGKIYVKDDFLFVGEKRQGFHVFDNTNPKNPIKKTFIEVFGSTDLAIRNHVLYINQASDLLTLKYDFDADSLKLLDRIEDVFPVLSSPDGYKVDSVPQGMVLIEWVKKRQLQ